MDNRVEKLIKTQQKMLAEYRVKADMSIPRRNDIIERAEKIYKTINVFSMYETIAFVDFNTGETLICKAVGEITLCDLMDIAQNYTLGKMVSYDVKEMTYIAAYCRKLTE